MSESPQDCSGCPFCRYLANTGTRALTLSGQNTQDEKQRCRRCGKIEAQGSGGTCASCVMTDISSGIVVRAKRQLQTRLPPEVYSQVSTRLLQCLGIASASAERCSWLARIPTLEQSSSMLRSALLTTCILHIATAQKDHRGLQQGRRRYSNIVEALGVEMRNPTLSHREILLIMFLLDLCDAPLVGTHSRFDLATTHYNGAEGFLLAYGIAKFDITDMTNRMVLSKVRKVAFFSNVVLRQGQRSCEKSISRHNGNPDPYSLVDWFDLAGPLPGLLEEADSILSGKQDPEKAEVLLMALCHRLETLRLDMLLELTKEGAPSRLQKPIETKISDIVIEEQHFMSTPDAMSVVPTRYHFDGFAQGGRHIFTWLSVILIDCTLLRIHHRQPFVRLFPGATPRPPMVLKQDAFEKALDICRSVFFLSGWRSPAGALFTKVLLEVLYAFFTQLEAAKQADWSRLCLAANVRRIERIQREGRKTFCRVAAMSAGLVWIVRFDSDDQSPKG